MDHSIDATIARIQAFAADRDDDRVANILVDLMPGGGLRWRPAKTTRAPG